MIRILFVRFILVVVLIGTFDPFVVFADQPATPDAQIFLYPTIYTEKECPDGTWYKVAVLFPKEVKTIHVNTKKSRPVREAFGIICMSPQQYDRVRLMTTDWWKLVKNQLDQNNWIIPEDQYGRYEENWKTFAHFVHGFYPDLNPILFQSSMQPKFKLIVPGVSAN